MKNLDFIDWAIKKEYGKLQVSMSILDVIIEYQDYMKEQVNNLPIKVVPELVCECLHQKWIDGVRTCQNKKCGKEFKTD